MDEAVRNVVGHAGVSLDRRASRRRRRRPTLLGLADRGRLEAGPRADVVALDAAFAVAAVWVAGTEVA